MIFIGRTRTTSTNVDQYVVAYSLEYLLQYTLYCDGTMSLLISTDGRLLQQQYSTTTVLDGTI